VTILCDSYM